MKNLVLETPEGSQVIATNVSDGDEARVLQRAVQFYMRGARVSYTNLTAHSGDARLYFTMGAQTQNPWYVGFKGGGLTPFHFGSTPTESSHGHLYPAVIGPFKTKRGALWAEKYGPGNPHFQTVADAEYFAKRDITRRDNPTGHGRTKMTPMKPTIRDQIKHGMRPQGSELTRADIGTIISLYDDFGTVKPYDVGKRVYHRSWGLAMENVEQRDKRRKGRNPMRRRGRRKAHNRRRVGTRWAVGSGKGSRNVRLFRSKSRALGAFRRLRKRTRGRVWMFKRK